MLEDLNLGAEHADVVSLQDSLGIELPTTLEIRYNHIQALFVVNLAERKMAGEVSQGMLLLGVECQATIIGALL